MSLRAALLALLTVVAVLAGAVLLLDDGPDPGARGPVLAPPSSGPEEAAPIPALPAPPPSDLAELGGPDAVAPLETAGALAPSARVEEPAETGSLGGRLVDPSGAPVAGEPVELLVSADAWWSRFRDGTRPQLADRTVSDGEGRFSLAARAGVVHELRAGGQRFARRQLTPVTAGDALEVVLERGLALEGTVLSAVDGSPLVGARVASVASADILATSTDARGRFRIEPVADRALVVAAWADGHDVTFQEVDAPGWGEVVVELPPGRTVRGRVVDRDTQEPVVGAQVVWELTGEAREVGRPDPFAGRHAEHRWETTSDAQGLFALEGLPSWSLRLEVRAEGYLTTVSKRYEERRLGPDDQVLVGLRPAEPVLAQVLDGVSGGAVAGAQVRAVVPGAVLDEVVSDGEGLASLAVDDWDAVARLELVASDAAGRHARARVRRSSEPLSLQLVEPLELTVVVQGDDGPLAGAQVALEADGSGPTSLVSTGPDGTALLRHPLAGPPPRRVHLQARHGTRQSLRQTFRLEDGPLPNPVLIDVDLGAFYAGRVIDGYGQPVAGASVAVPRAVPVRSDDAGRFRIGPVDREPDDPVRLTADADGYRPARLDGVLPGDGLEVLLEPVVLWHGRVLDAGTGEPLDRFSGRLQRQVIGDDGLPTWRQVKTPLQRTGVPGAFTVELAEAGTYQLALGAQDYQKTTSVAVPFNGLNPPPPLDLFLSRAAVLQLLVEDGGGRPVVGLDVVLVDADLARELRLPTGKARKGAPTARTDDEGRVRFQLGDGGRYRLASGPGDWLLPGQLQVLPGLPVERVVRLGATGDLEVAVSDDRGQPLPGARVTVKAIGRDRGTSLRRRSRGSLDDHRVLFEALPPGSYQVDVSQRSFSGRREEVVVIAGGLARLDLSLAPRVQGQGRGPSGGGSGGSPGGAGGGGGRGGRGGDGRRGR